MPPGPGPGSAWTDSGHPGQGLGISWVNAHGGAGATTLSRRLGGSDMGPRWPDLSRGHPGRMLIVARTHAAGLQAASRALDALHKRRLPPGLELLALVLVADAPGHLPLPLARRVRVLGGAAHVHRIPWVPAWRVGAQVANPPREVRALAELIGISSSTHEQRK
ncbi:DUF6668 family protein [Streptomyces chartreusis]|uniref:DUF6668 family protein n=1 Tax=Streptomyces chartreusis TaxID=1969 RepID=UPI0036949215